MARINSRGILKNEKYKGDILQGKTYTTDQISHRRVVNMEEENQTHYNIGRNIREVITKNGGTMLEKLPTKKEKKNYLIKASQK